MTQSQRTKNPKLIKSISSPEFCVDMYTQYIDERHGNAMAQPSQFVPSQVISLTQDCQLEPSQLLPLTQNNKHKNKKVTTCSECSRNSETALCIKCDNCKNIRCIYCDEIE